MGFRQKLEGINKKISLYYKCETILNDEKDFSKNETIIRSNHS